MPRPLIPPRGRYIPTKVLFDPDLSPPLRDTLIQLMALAWATQGHSTPRLSYEILTALTGKSKRTLQGHIADLRDKHTALRLQIAAAGDFIIVFEQRLWDSPRRRRIPHSPVKEEEEEESIIKLIKPPPPPAVPVQTTGVKVLVQGQGAKICAGPTADDPMRGLEPELVDELLEAGIFPSLLDEVGRSGRPPEALRALLAWARADKPTQPGGLFIARLRAGARPPERISQAFCPRCGGVNEHAEGCYMRFASPADGGG